jgi:hypothetical protein
MEVLKGWTQASAKQLCCPASTPLPRLHPTAALQQHAHGLLLSLAGSLHSITLFSMSSLIISVVIAFSGVFLGKLRIAQRYEVSPQFTLHTTDASGSKNITLRYPGRGT